MVPMKTSPASEALGEATATSPCLISFSRTNAVPSVDGNHNVGSLDDRVGGMALREAAIDDGLVGDRRRDDRAADIDPDMRRGSAFHHVDDGAFELVARAELDVRFPLI
jgi:hypothetical protein